MNNSYLSNEQKKSKKRVVVYETKEPLSIGDRIPNVDLLEKNSAIKLHSLITDHLILVIASSTCGACEGTLETIYEFTRENKTANIVLIFNSNIDSFKRTKLIFGDSIRIFPMDIETMLNEFKTTFLPLGFSLDGGGIIKSSHAFSDMEMFLELLQPVGRN
ncbi:hypothetical protein [Paenibacillus puerhi]|uniref:hypothetical protein n=1 Tax=Paenibacillus puerhi TaxID=2692622 RepID=UPI00135C1FE5|nr:hypothetical protein [Paenibacillus puerhi]